MACWRRPRKAEGEAEHSEAAGAVGDVEAEEVLVEALAAADGHEAHFVAVVADEDEGGAAEDGFVFDTDADVEDGEAAEGVEGGDEGGEKLAAAERRHVRSRSRTTWG